MSIKSAHSTLRHRQSMTAAVVLVGLGVSLGASLEASVAQAAGTVPSSLLDESQLAPLSASSDVSDRDVSDSRGDQAAVLATTAERNQEPRPAFTFAEHNLISGESIELQAESLAIAIDTWEQERSTDEAFDLWHVVDVTLANVELERPEGDTDGVSRVSVAGLYFERRWHYRPDQTLMHVDFRLSSTPLSGQAGKHVNDVVATTDAAGAPAAAIARMSADDLSVELTRMKGLTRLSLRPLAVRLATID